MATSSKNKSVHSSVINKVLPNAKDLEKEVLGHCMTIPGVFDEVNEILHAEAFYLDNSQRIFRAMVALSGKNQPIDIMTVAEQLRKSEDLETIGGLYALVKIKESSETNPRNATTHALIIKEKYLRRELISLSWDISKNAYEESTDVFDAIELADKGIAGVNNSIGNTEVKHVSDAVMEVVKELDRLRSTDEPFAGAPTGFPELNKITNGWQPTDLIIIAARPSVGKCLGKGTKVLMFNGELKKVENIMIGDVLMGDDSTPRNVLSLARGREMMYRVKQVRGIEYRINESHILSLMCSRNESQRKHGDKIDMPLTEYLSKSSKFRNNWKGYKTGIEFKEKPYTIPPYLLGLWIGDGTSLKPEVTKPDNEIMSYMSGYADGVGMKLRIDTPISRCRSYSIVAKKKNIGSPNFIELLKDINVFDNKHIPDNYLYNSKEYRMQLLAGLLDTDGHLLKSGGYEISQKEKELAYQIKFLADSLGFRTTIVHKKSTIKSIGFTGYYYRIYIWGDIHNIPMKIKRKTWTKTERARDHLISGLSITKDCVDDYYGFVIDGNHRFLLEDCTVTHNTAFALNLARNAAVDERKPTPVLFFSLEMSAAQLTQRLASSESNIYFERIRSGKMSDSDYKEFYDKGIVKISNMPIYIDDTAYLNLASFKAKSRRMVKKHKVGLIIVDYLQLMSNNLSGGQNREQQVSDISRNIKQLAKELRVPIIALSQLSREIEKRSNKKPNLSDLRESGAIEQDADLVFGLSSLSDEEDVKNTLPSKDGLLNSLKNRNGMLKDIKMRFYGAVQKWLPIEFADEYEGDTGFQKNTQSDLFKEPAKRYRFEEEELP